MSTIASARRSSARRAESKAAAGAPYTDLWSRPGFLVRRLHQIHAGLFADECNAFDITPVQYAMLTVLVEGTGMDQATLSMAVGVDRASGADVIKRLERRGLLTRMVSVADRRAMLVHITAEGRSIARRMHGAMERSQRRLIEPLDAAEREQFTRLMQKLVEANDDASRAPRG